VRKREGEGGLYRRAGQKFFFPAFFKLYLSDTPACAIFLPCVLPPSLPPSLPFAAGRRVGRDGASRARESKLRLGGYGASGRRGEEEGEWGRGGDRDRTGRGDPGNEGMRAALLIRVYLPLHSCLHRETSVALTLAVLFAFY